MGKIRIVSNGTRVGTRILTEDGKELNSVSEVKLEITANREPLARLTLWVPEADVIADAEIDPAEPPEYLRRLFETWAFAKGLAPVK